MAVERGAEASSDGGGDLLEGLGVGLLKGGASMTRRVGFIGSSGLSGTSRVPPAMATMSRIEHLPSWR